MKLIQQLTTCLLLSVLVVAPSWAAERLEQQHSLEGVSRLSFSGDIVVELTQGPANSAKVEFDEGALEHIEISVSDKTFHIERKDSFWDFWRDKEAVEIRVTMELQTLQSLDLSGAVRLHSEALEAEQLSVVLTGACQVQLGKLSVQALEATLSGASQLAADTLTAQTIAMELTGASRVDVSGSGSAPSMTLELTGASGFQAAGVAIKVADISATGASNVEVQVTESLNATLTGASNLRYKGQPDVRVSSTGASTIESM